MWSLQYLTSNKTSRQAGKYDLLSEVNVFNRSRHRNDRW